MNDRMYRDAMGKFATGVTVITTEVDNDIHGMTANAFMSVSLDPKLLLISIGNKANMYKRIKKSGKFAVNILSERQKDISMLFAGQNKQEKNIEFKWLENLPIIDESIVSLACNVYDSYETGDHTLFVGEVINLEMADGSPLTVCEGQYGYRPKLIEA